jgi:O-antigen/teichoic acid export membrane protein
MLTLAAALGALFWFLLGDWAITLTFGPEYEASARILAVHSLAAIPYLQGEIRTVVMVASGLQSHAPAWSFTGVVLNAALNAWWIPTMGPVGAAWATLVAYLVVWMLGTVAIRPLRWLAREQWLVFFRMPLAWRWVHDCREALRERSMK